MITLDLPYDGNCIVKIKINIHGTEKELQVLVDTEFVTETGFGLKLPLEYKEFASFTGTGSVKLADGRRVSVDTISNTNILEMHDKILNPKLIIPALFLDGFPVMGMWVLQKCILDLNGPSKKARITIP